MFKYRNVKRLYYKNRGSEAHGLRFWEEAKVTKVDLNVNTGQEVLNCRTKEANGRNDP